MSTAAAAAIAPEQTRHFGAIYRLLTAEERVRVSALLAGVSPTMLASTHQTYTEEQPNSLTPIEVPVFPAKMRELYPQHFAFVAMGFATGLRPSTLRPVRRSGATPDVLWGEGVVLIRRSHTRKQEVMDKPKTGLRQRLTPAAVAAEDTPPRTTA